MKWIVQDPVTAFASLKNRNNVIASAIGELCRLGPQPATTSMPNETFKDGFAHFFAKQDLFPTLISNARLENEDKGIDFVIYLEVILDLLYSIYLSSPPPSPNLLEQFVESGGIEFLRMSGEYPGSEILTCRYVDVYELGQAIKTLLVSTEEYLRVCAGCGKREGKMEEFRVCAKCRYLMR